MVTSIKSPEPLNPELLNKNPVAQLPGSFAAALP